MSPYKLECFSISDIGRNRKNNEDAFLEMPELGFFALADGMGGHQAGEVASKEAIAQISQSVQELNTISIWELELLLAHMKQAVILANARIHTLAKEKENFRGMGTTLSCFLIHKNNLLFAHVGDSRLYRYRKTLTQLTEDHSLKRELIKKGALKLEDAPRFRRTNIVTKAVGTSSSVAPDLGKDEVLPGDIYFLCSDGLTDHLSDEHIARVLYNTPSIQEASSHLVEAALSKGGRDNITIVMVKILPFFVENLGP